MHTSCHDDVDDEEVQVSTLYYTIRKEALFYEGGDTEQPLGKLAFSLIFFLMYKKIFIKKKKTSFILLPHAKGMRRSVFSGSLNHFCPGSILKN